MGNTICQTPCNTLHTEIDLCTLMSAAATVDAEFAKTPRVEPLHHSEHSGLHNLQYVSSSPGGVPSLNLRKPGETHREQMAMANVLAASQTILTQRSDCSSDSDGANDTAVGSWVGNRSLREDSLSRSTNTHLAKIGLQVPKLHLRKPDETAREHAALAKLEALPPDTSRSDLEEPVDAKKAHLSANILSRPSSSPVLSRPSSNAGHKLPKLNLRPPGETHREAVAVANILASPPETDRSDDADYERYNEPSKSPVKEIASDRKSNPQDPDSRTAEPTSKTSSRVQLKGKQIMVPKTALSSNRMHHQ